MVYYRLPVIQQVTSDLVIPPLLTCLWWLMSRAWAFLVTGANVSEKMKNRQRKEFWILLAVMYAAMFGITAYYTL
jgi:hypothetical protein